MNQTQFYAPTKVIFGADTEKQIGDIIANYGYKKVLIHYGGQSALRSGLIDHVEQSLISKKIDFVELGGVVPNPVLSLVYQGITLAKTEKVDFILAIGGGSVIDSAKAIGYGAANEQDVWDYYSTSALPQACLPIGTILTIAAAGSEMSNSSVITNEAGNLKRSCGTDLSRPLFSIMDPTLTLTLPDYQTAAGCVDIMMHTMERYFNHSDNLELTDAISESLLRVVKKNALLLAKEPQNLAARGEVMWASSLSHNGLTGFGTDGGDFATHKIEHELSGMFDVTHGAGLAVVWPNWARYVFKERLERFVQFAVNVMDVEPCTDAEETALKGIHAMENFYHALKMPTNLKELGLNPTEAELQEMAEKCDYRPDGTIGIVKKLAVSDVYAILKCSR